MKNLIEKIHIYFIPESYRGDEITYRRARIFINTTLITSLFAMFFLLNTIRFKMPMAYNAMIVCIIGFLLFAFLFKWGVSHAICTNLYVALGMGATAWDMYFAGGLHSIHAPWLAFTAVGSVLIGSIAYARVWVSVAVLTLIIFAIGARTGFDFPPNELSVVYLDEMATSALAGLILIMFTVVVVIENAYLSTLKKLDKKNQIIEEEKRRSDDLLLNILPYEVSEELKKTGKTHAQSYTLVTVMFADFKDFTLISEKLIPEDLVSGIDEYFETFDRIIAKYNIEKIKTVGDAYIVAGGVPISNLTNPVDIVDAALEILLSVHELKRSRTAQGKVSFDLRIGIHTGPLVAGVVGIKKFAYDIWGDTVNTAARMQENGIEDKINISGTTNELIRHRFKTTHRGRILAKHKGEIDMYFVEEKII